MIRRFLTRVLIIILIAVCGYNVWLVHQLQGQVARLELQTQPPDARRGHKTPGAAGSVDRSWLDQADLHAGRARVAVLQGDLPTAQRELQRGVDDIHRAVRQPEEQTQETLGRARRTLASLQGQADNLWRQVHAAKPDSSP